MKKSIPNILTVLRIVVTFAFLFFLFQKGFAAKLLAFVCFAAASISDYLDGYFARKWNVISKFGQLMDPIADKFLTLSAFYSFACFSLIPFWLVHVIAGREIFITIFRLIMQKKGVTLPAERGGKMKTVLQIVTIIYILLQIVLWEKDLYLWQFDQIVPILTTSVLFVTVMTGVVIVRNTLMQDPLRS